MKIAYKKRLINPIFPCGMDGYNEKRFRLNQTEEFNESSEETVRTAKNQLDDIELSTLVIQAGQTMVLNALDLALLDDDYCQRVIELVSKKSGISSESIILSCSHTHSSPMTSKGLFTPQVPDAEYLDDIASAIVLNVKDCLRNLKEASATFSTHSIKGFFNNRNNPEGYYRDKIDRIDFFDSEGLELVSLLNIACHPTVLGAQNHYVSADFFGPLRKYVQARIKMPVMVVNGECGDVSCRLLKHGADWDEVERTGVGIGQQVLSDTATKTLDFSNLEIIKVPYLIDYFPKKNAYLLEKKAELNRKIANLETNSREAAKIRTSYLVDVEAKLALNQIQYRLNCFVFNFSDIRFIAMPFEIDSTLGKRLREFDEKETILCAYSNGFHIYAVNKEEYGKVFESYNTHFPYGAADELVDKIIQSYR